MKAINQFQINELLAKIQQLEKENAELKTKAEHYERIAQVAVNEMERLKQQLSEIKYLNRQEVEKILFERIDDSEDNFDMVQGIITAICNLAVEIDKDKIVEVLKGFTCRADMVSEFAYVITEPFFDKVADEIIKSMGGK